MSSAKRSSVCWLLDNLRELLLSVLRKHRNENVVDDFYFRLVQGCNFDENIFRFGADLRVIAVDDRW